MTDKLSIGAQGNQFPLEQLPAGVHICWRVDGELDYSRSLSATVRAAVLAGAELLYILDRRSPAALQHQLRTLAPDATAQGRISVLDPSHILLDHGRFEVQSALERVRERTKHARAGGFPAPWFIVEMSWATWGLPGSEHWREFESKLDSADKELYGMFLGQYDRRHCPPDMLAEALRFYPFILFDGWVVVNRVYPGAIPPPILERDVVMAQFGLDEEAYLDYLRIFIEEAENHLSRLAQEVQALDAKGVEYHAHSLKGAAATIGAAHVRQAAWELEQMGKRENLAGAPEMLETLRQEVERVRRLLNL
ncbi:MAG: MEDS domain-containing protein [Anaerolineae bacterium]